MRVACAASQRCAFTAPPESRVRTGPTPKPTPEPTLNQPPNPSVPSATRRERNDAQHPEERLRHTHYLPGARPGVLLGPPREASSSASRYGRGAPGLLPGDHRPQAWPASPPSAPAGAPTSAPSTLSSRSSTPCSTPAATTVSSGRTLFSSSSSRPKRRTRASEGPLLADIGTIFGTEPKSNQDRTKFWEITRAPRRRGGA